MNVFELFAKLTLDSNEYNKALDDAGEKGKGFLSNLGTVLGGVGAAVGTATIAAVGTAAAGIVSITKTAVESYAEYEQLVGGVETLFKESADIVQNYASEAYKTAGVSANEYMSTVTSFSASLIQGLSGDTEKAAEYANRALIDMSDNANKMGTDMASIQNAYQGFAKQNYTMLDNLKLGYGGTKEEMARLIEHAATLTEIQNELNVTVDAGSMSFDNIINAISVVQKELDISGTTVEEAEKTISGSLNMVKASAQDLMTSLAGGGVELDVALDNLMYSVEKFSENIIPAVEKTLYGIAELIQKLAPMIAERLPDLINTLVPILISTAMTIVNSLVDAFPSFVQTIGQTLIDILPDLVNAFVRMLDSLLTDILPVLFELAIALVLALGQGIADNAVQLMDSVVDLILFIVKTFIENLPEIIRIGLLIIASVVEGILKNIDKIGRAIGEMIPMIIDVIIDSLPDLIIMGGEIILALVAGVVLAIPKLIKSIAEGMGLVKKQIKNDTDDMDRTVKNSNESINTRLSGLERELGISKESIQSKTGEMVNVTKDSVTQAEKYASEIVAVSNVTKAQVETILNGLGPTFNGILGLMNTFVLAFNDYVDKAINKLKEFGNMEVKPKVDPSGVESGCRAIVNAVDDAIDALRKLSSAGSGVSFGGGRASGGWMDAGTTYLVGELGPELVTPTRSMYVHNAKETSGIYGGNGDVYITIQGDVYDDERSMRRKLKSAVLNVLEEQVAYG